MSGPQAQDTNEKDPCNSTQSGGWPRGPSEVVGMLSVLDVVGALSG